MRTRSMRTQRLPLVFVLLSIFLLLLAQSALAQDAASSRGFAVDVRVGAAFESSELGASTGVGDGFFRLQRVEVAPLVGIGLSLPEFGPGIRPLILASYAPPADLAGSWTPCDPGLDCPSILPPAVDGQASRLEATAGLEFPILEAIGPARPYGTVAVGLRRYGFSYGEIGQPGDSFRLAEGSFSETDFLARFAVGTGFRVGGGYEALLEGGAKLAMFGAGRVPVPSDVFVFEDLSQWAEPTIDLGRTSHTDFVISVGLRRYLN